MAEELVSSPERVKKPRTQFLSDQCLGIIDSIVQYLKSKNVKLPHAIYCQIGEAKKRGSTRRPLDDAKTLELREKRIKRKEMIKYMQANTAVQTMMTVQNNRRYNMPDNPTISTGHWMRVDGQMLPGHLCLGKEDVYLDGRLLDLYKPLCQLHDRVADMFNYAFQFKASLKAKVLSASMKTVDLDVVKDKLNSMFSAYSELLPNSDKREQKKNFDTRMITFRHDDGQIAFMGTDIGDGRALIPGHAESSISSTTGCFSGITGMPKVSIVGNGKRFAKIMLHEHDSVMVVPISERSPKVQFSSTLPYGIVCQRDGVIRALPLFQRKLIYTQTIEDENVKGNFINYGNYTFSGDSGGALVDEVGNLCGMHMFTQGGICFTKKIIQSIKEAIV